MLALFASSYTMDRERVVRNRHRGCHGEVALSAFRHPDTDVAPANMFEDCLF
jgi:hypothetical protein